MEALKAQGVTVGGMISREAREGGERVGFEILDLTNGKHGWLAHVNQKVGPQVGKYHVNIFATLKTLVQKPFWKPLKNALWWRLMKLVPWSFIRTKFKQAVKQALASGKMVYSGGACESQRPVDR